MASNNGADHTALFSMSDAGHGGGLHTPAVINQRTVARRQGDPAVAPCVGVAPFDDSPPLLCARSATIPFAPPHPPPPTPAARSFEGRLVCDRAGGSSRVILTWPKGRVLT